ncbi:hypothetical protein FQZ97_540490 [compost metagenome]
MEQEAAPEVVEVQRQAPFGDAWVLAAQALDGAVERRVDAGALQRHGQHARRVVGPVDRLRRLVRRVGTHPVARQAPALGRRCGIEVVLPRIAPTAALQLAQQRRREVLARAGHGPGLAAMRAGEFAHEVCGGLVAQGGHAAVACIAFLIVFSVGRRQQVGHHVAGEVVQCARDVGFELLQRIAPAEQRQHLHRGTRAAQHRFAVRDQVAVLPVEQGQRAFGRAPGEQARLVLHADERAQQAHRVVVVNALLVALLVARRSEAANHVEQLRMQRVFGQQREHLGPRALGLAVEQRLQQPAGEVFGARQLGRLGHQRLVPVALQRQQPGFVDRALVVGARHLVGHALVAGHERQVDRLAVHGEGVAAQAQRVAALAHQLALVADGAQGLVARGLQARVELVGRHRGAQRAQVGDQRVQLADHRVGREVAVDLRQVAELRDAARNAVEDATCRVDHALRAALPGVDQALAARGQRLVHGLALLGDVGQEVFLLGEAAFDFFELGQEARERVVALLGRVGELQRVLDRLAEKLELRAELGTRLGRAQRLAPRARIGAHAVDVGVDQRDAVEDRRADHRIAARQAAQLLGQQVESGGLLVERGEHLAERGRRGEVGEFERELVQRLALAVEGRVGRQKLHRALADALLLDLERGVHRSDARQVGVAQLLEHLQRAAPLAQPAQRLHEIVGRAPEGAGNVDQQRVLLVFRAGQRARGFAADGVDLFELGQRAARHLGDAAQLAHEAGGLGRVEPEVGVAHAGALADQVFVGGARGRLLAHRAGDAHEVAHAAHQLGVADLAEEAGGGRLRAHVLFAGEGRLPQLHRVHARGLDVVAVEHQHAAVGKARVAVGDDRRGELLVDQVVVEQRIAPGLRVVEHIGHVFAVGRAQHALEAQVFHHLGRQVEAFVLARLQVVAARKNDAVVFGQLHAGAADGVDALDLLRADVEHQVARDLLAVGLHAQQDQHAQLGPGDLGVGERLALVLHRLAVDAQPGLGVVLDLDREVAAQRLDEHGVEHVHVRVLAAHVVFARGHGPLEIVARGQGDVALAAVVDVIDVAVALDGPAEHAHVVQLLADLERGKQLVLRDAQLQQRGLLVVGVELAEVGGETRVFEEGAGQRHRLQLVVLGGGFAWRCEPVQAEHVAHGRFLAQADEDVVAEQQQVADAHDVARHGVVLGARAGAQDQRLVGAAELGQPLLVERLRLLEQALALGFEPLLQQVVAAAAGDQRFGGVDGGLGAGRRCGVVGGLHGSARSVRAQQCEQFVAVRLGVEPGADAVQLVDAVVAVAAAQRGQARLAHLLGLQPALPAVGQQLVEPAGQAAAHEGAPFALVEPEVLAGHAAVDAEVGPGAHAQALHQPFAFGAVTHSGEVEHLDHFVVDLMRHALRVGGLPAAPVVHVHHHAVAVAALHAEQGFGERDGLHRGMGGATALQVRVHRAPSAQLRKEEIRFCSADFWLSVPSLAILLISEATLRFWISPDELPSAPTMSRRSFTTSRSPESCSLKATCTAWLLEMTPPTPLPTDSERTKLSK